MAFIFEISIPSTRKVRNYTEYQIIVITNIPEFNSTYTRSYKRYSEVLKLHRQIRDHFPKLPEFPKKTWFRRMNPVVIETRRRLFEAYFNYILDFIIKNDLKGEEYASKIFKFFNK